MPSFLKVLLFTAVTLTAWGVYGPVLRIGSSELGDDGWETLRAFICVGVAYFLTAVLMPIGVLAARGETGAWTLNGSIWSFAAGAMGALGAFGVILALAFGGHASAVYVMPLVFGSAPVVNTLVASWMGNSFKEASALFYAAIVVVVVGAVGVLIFKPGGSPTTATAVAAEAGTTEALEAVDADHVGPSLGDKVVWIPLSIALAGLCWGAYGPVLHKGQMKMSGSRLRPFLCVGLAYFVVAVVLPGLILSSASAVPEGTALEKAEAAVAGDDGATWTAKGTFWSLMGGLAGAVGAIGLIMAFTFGGKPVFVMPLVFGLAPVVNTFVSLLGTGQLSQLDSPWFWVSLGVLVLGAVAVLLLAPRPHAAVPAPVAGEVPPSAPDPSAASHQSRGFSPVDVARQPYTDDHVPTESQKQGRISAPTEFEKQGGVAHPEPPSAGAQILNAERRKS